MAASNVDQRFEPEAWAGLGFSEQVRISCEGYVREGIALPWIGYAYHALKLTLLVAGWFYFVSFTPGMGSVTDFSAWWAEGIAFQKAFLWATD